MPKAEISLSTPAPVSGSAILAFFPLLMSPVSVSVFFAERPTGKEIDVHVARVHRGVFCL